MKVMSNSGTDRERFDIMSPKYEMFNSLENRQEIEAYRVHFSVLELSPVQSVEAVDQSSVSSRALERNPFSSLQESRGD